MKPDMNWILKTMIKNEVIEDWVKNKKRIQDRLNRINKRLKKFNKQKAHFELRLREIAKHEKQNNVKGNVGDSSSN